MRSLLNLLKLSVIQEFERLPSPVVVYTANAIYALTRPNHYMSEMISDYIKGRKGKGLPKHELPMIDKRLSSLTPSQTRERTWLLAMLAQSLQVRHCSAGNALMTVASPFAFVQNAEAHAVCKRKGLYGDVLYILDTPKLDANSHRAALRVGVAASAYCANVTVVVSMLL